MLRELPFVAFEIAPDGTVAEYSELAARLVGYGRLWRGCPLEIPFDPTSCARIRSRLDAVRSANSNDYEPPVRLVALDRDGRTVPIEMQLVGFSSRQHLRARLFVCETTRPELLMGALIDHTEVLRGFIETSSEPMWGIEFDEPVDLRGTEDDIVRQVFVNECHWIFCNAALHQLYELPEGEDMRDKPVAAHFPRNAQNESFVRQLARSDFNVERSLTVDLKHDGTATYVENNVRGHIESGRLHRMWGTLRDVTELRREHEQIVRQGELVHRVLAALPVAVVVVDREARITGVNPAAEALLGAGAVELLDTALDTRVVLTDETLKRRWFNGEPHEGDAEIHLQSGLVIGCNLRIAPVDDELSELFVISVVPVASTHARRRQALYHRGRS
ncbi:PAS domain-containing protein [Paraburkholderia sp. J67]|uniref:PAS domain-containing protein n=1 Tax=Paraburkholderia sp. J67 TaxID=2805435 RepID=UPI002ABE6806|nr:PAS domain-containing protein [Paraburkholderia sp. J67]